MNYSDIIKNRILELCNNQNLSINRLSLLSGLSQSTVENIMQGTSKNPSIVTLHRIANALGMTPAEFLDFPEMNSWEFED